jgi:hypothetical protein
MRLDAVPPGQAFAMAAGDVTEWRVERVVDGRVYVCLALNHEYQGELRLSCDGSCEVTRRIQWSELEEGMVVARAGNQWPLTILEAGEKFVVIRKGSDPAPSVIARRDWFGMVLA